VGNWIHRRQRDFTDAGWLPDRKLWLAAGILLYLFAVHTRFAENPFIARELFLDWNFMLGLIFVFLVGCVLYLPVILLPLQLEQLGGYPPDAVGELMMSRGLGTVISLTLMSRLRDRVDLGADEHHDPVAFTETFPGPGVRAVLPDVRRR